MSLRCSSRSTAVVFYLQLVVVALVFVLVLIGIPKFAILFANIGIQAVRVIARKRIAPTWMR